MTVAEFIAKLQTMPQDLLVYTDDNEYGPALSDVEIVSGDSFTSPPSDGRQIVQVYGAGIRYAKAKCNESRNAE